MDTTTLSLSNYQTRLPSFEGPLDVLLRLIEKRQMEITEVSLVEVTDQFLAYVASLDAAAPNAIAEFTMVGTRLTLLKSRSLLPRPPAVGEDDEPDPGDLVQQLRAYKRLKEVASLLGERRDSGLASFGPHASSPVARPGQMVQPKLAQYEPTALIRSLRRRLSAVPQAMQTVRQRRIVSIREMIDRVIDFATRGPSFQFSAVTDGYERRSEVATAFLAVLVLIRRQSLTASQEGLFGDIDLARSAEPADADMDLDDAANEFTIAPEPEPVSA